MSETLELIKDPYAGINISILFPCRSFEAFEGFYHSMVDNGGSHKDVEMIIKVDHTKQLEDYENILQKGKFKFKLLTYPSYQKRMSLHLFFNDMGALASGKLLWVLFEDGRVIKGNWYQALMDSLRHIKESIHYIKVPHVVRNKEGILDDEVSRMTSAPIITRAWYNFFNGVSPFPNADRWLYELGKRIRRRYAIDPDTLLMEFPKGNRVFSKADRKEILYPAIDKSEKTFRDAIIDPSSSSASLQR